MNPHWGEVRGGSNPSPPPYDVPLRPVLCFVPGDLPQEWLYLRTQVFPHLDALCQARGTRFAPVDIHWDEEEASHRPCDPALRRHPLSSQQLKVSLDLIAHSSSFLCLLGHRYGPSRPEDSLPLPPPGPGREALFGMERSLGVAAEGGYPWVLAGRNHACSPTELQVARAALVGDPRHCFFYFRDYSLQDGEDGEERDGDAGRRRRSLLRAFAGEAERERRRALALKDRVVAGLLPVRFFQTLEELGELVLRDWTGLIEQLYGPPLPEQNPASSDYQDTVDRRHHEGAVHALCRWFVPSSQTTAVLETLDTFTLRLTLRLTPNEPGSAAALLPRTSAAELTCSYESSDTESSIVLLSGERGCGKSSLAAWWIQEFRKKNPGIRVVPHFCGISSSSVDIGSVLRQLTLELHQAHYGSRPEWTEGLLDRVRPRPLHAAVQAFTAAAALGPCVLVLDGLDQLTGSLGLSTQEVKQLRWLPAPLPSQCKLVLTTASTDLTCKSLTLRPDVRAPPWPRPSDPRHRRDLLLRHLRPAGPEPPGPPLLQDLLGGRLARLPLYLALMGGELRASAVLRGDGEAEALAEGYTEAKTAAELWERVFWRWVRDYGDGGEVCEGSPSRANQTGPSETELGGWVWDALCLVHLSRSGPTEKQLLALLEALGDQGSERRVLPLEWARFRAAAGPWLRERASGTLSLAHQSQRQAMDLLLQRIGPGRGPGGLRRRTRRDYQLALVRFFQRQDRELCSWALVLEEVPWLLEQCEAWEQLHAFLTDPETVDQLSLRWGQSPQLRMDTVRFWTLLTLRGFDPHTSYQSLLGKEVHGSLPPVALTDAEPQRDIDSSTAFMTETRSQENDPACLYGPAARGRVGVFVSELLLALGREGEAERTMLQSQDALAQAGDEETESAVLLLTVQQTLAELGVAVGQPRQAERHCVAALRTAQALATSCSQPGHLAVRKGQLLCTLCQLMLADGRAGEASRILRDILSTGHDRVHPCSEATVSLLRGLLRIGRNELTEAEGHLQAALRTRRSWYGGQHPLVVEVEERLADIWAETSRGIGLRQTRAVELYRHVVCVKDQAMELCPSTSPQAQTKAHSLTLTLVKLGRLLWQGSSTTERRETIELLQRALDLSIRFLGPAHIHTKDIQRSLTTEFRQVVTSPDPRCRPSSHRKLSASRPKEGTPLCPHTGSDRAAAHAPRDPSRERPLSSWSGWSQPEPDLEPVKSRNRSAGWKERSPAHWSTFQTTVFGPRSDIGDLILPPPRLRPRTAPGSANSRSAEGTRAGRRAGWCSLPGRYLLEEQLVTALNRQIGSPVHGHRHTPMLRQTGQREGTNTAAGTM